MLTRLINFLRGRKASNERRSTVPGQAEVDQNVRDTALPDTASLVGDNYEPLTIPSTPTILRNVIQPSKGQPISNTSNDLSIATKVTIDSPRHLQSQPLVRAVDPRTYRDQDDDQGCGCFGLRKRNR